jgi:hypothetical protein
MSARAWRNAAVNADVWRRTLKLGLGVGLLQVAVNQGDAWLRHAADTPVVVKSILSPMISMGIAWLSAASMYVHANKRVETQVT